LLANPGGPQLSAPDRTGIGKSFHCKWCRESYRAAFIKPGSISLAEYDSTTGKLTGSCTIRNVGGMKRLYSEGRAQLRHWLCCSCSATATTTEQEGQRIFNPPPGWLEFLKVQADGSFGKIGGPVCSQTCARAYLATNPEISSGPSSPYQWRELTWCKVCHRSEDAAPIGWIVTAGFDSTGKRFFGATCCSIVCTQKTLDQGRLRAA